MKLRETFCAIVLCMLLTALALSGCGRQETEDENEYIPQTLEPITTEHAKIDVSNRQFEITVTKLKLKEFYPRGEGTITAVGAATMQDGERKNFRILATGFFRYDKDTRELTMLTTDDDIIEHWNNATSMNAEITISIDVGGAMQRLQQDIIFTYAY